MNTGNVGARLSRRRFLAISGAALGAGMVPAAALSGVTLHRWRGVALGAAAEIRLRHPDEKAARQLLDGAHAEIRRLEAIFSLYDAGSALSRLNRDGRIEAPPLELVELLGLSRRISVATAGAFDPSVQPLWQFYAERFAGNGDATVPPAGRIAAILEHTGFGHVRIAPDVVAFDRPGMALTLNGIAQGFITDRVSTLLRSGGIADILVDLGEISASGSQDGDAYGWRVTLSPDHGSGAEHIDLRDRAVASSAILGTTFDAAGRIGHILDPRTGLPARSGLTGASVIAGSAALADGLSTAALICGKNNLADALRAFPGTAARLVGEAGQAEWLQA